VSWANDRLAEELKAALGLARIENLVRLSGGASRETWAFGDGTRGYILRRDPAGAGGSEGTVDRETEARVIEAARLAGAPAPKIVKILDPHAFVMERLAGETDPRTIQREPSFDVARRRFAEDCAGALARIHATPFEGLPKLSLMDAEAQLSLYRGILDRFGAVRPIFELAMRWLLVHRPAAIAPVLVHGDFRLGNLLIGPNGLIAALDWELAHFGDPAEDLGWLLVRSWRFGAKREAGGLASFEELVAAYPRPIDPTRVRYWQIFGTFKWGVMCLIQADRHLSGRQASLEHAAIGRRASEAEYDLMNLLG